jgi:glutamate transport system permease protein
MSTTSGNLLFDAPGPKARGRYRLAAIVGGALVLAFLGFVLYQLGSKGNLEADKWAMFLGFEVNDIDANVWVDYLLAGLGNTLKAAAISIVLAGIFGFVFGVGRMSRLAVIRWFCTVVIEFFRSVPVLVMMLGAFYYYSYNNVFVSDVNPLAAVITGLTLYNGSVIAELLRSGVGSLPAGQAEAGLSIGLTRGQTLRSIQLPQAVTAMLPALVGQLVVVLKDTALGQIITYNELLTNYQRIGSTWGNIVPAMIVIATIYILINYALTSLAAYVEGRLRRRGRTTIGAGGGGAQELVLAEPELTDADQPGEDLQGRLSSSRR